MPRVDASYQEAADVECNMTLLQGVAAKPMWPPGGFKDWLTGLTVRAVEDEIAAARKVERVAEWKRRSVTSRATPAR